MKLLLMTGLLCAALIGCGQRGPLYFPDAPEQASPAQQSREPAAPAQDDTDEDAEPTPAAP